MRIMKLERVFDITLNDPDMIWEEDRELANLNLVSTTSLLELIHSLSFRMVLTSPDETSVVVSTNARYIFPLRIGQIVRVRLFIANHSGRHVLIKAEIVDEEGEKCFEAEIVRRIVPKELIRRLTVEKTEKVWGL